jgi:hypothetical protein
MWKKGIYLAEKKKTFFRICVNDHILGKLGKEKGRRTIKTLILISMHTRHKKHMCGSKIPNLIFAYFVPYFR